MKYEACSDGVVLTGCESFDIKDILECGQCFRFEKLGDMEYEIVARKKILTIKQTYEAVFFSPCSITEFEEIWFDYFDLGCDYEKIKDKLSENDKVMKEAVKFGKGIRILNQERVETIISFIISQNKQIPGIKRIVRDMSEKYGERIDDCYAFPDLEALARLNITDYINLKTGFRAKYIEDAVKKIYTGEIDIYPGADKTTEEIRRELMKICGIGPKVANCILLFSFGRRESFPVDVWVARALESLYFSGEKKSIKEMEAWANERFGEYGGYAQQYLFYYAREGMKQCLEQ